MSGYTTVTAVVDSIFFVIPRYAVQLPSHARGYRCDCLGGWSDMLPSDQTSSSSDEACGFSTTYCCEPKDTCVTQGLCQDRNNYLNGALTYFVGATGPENYTRLYKTASCTNEDWSNCINHCPSSSKQSKHALARCWR